MKIYYDLKAFFDVTKPIFSANLYDLPIVADSVAMRFYGWRYEELIDFCRRNPKFHLISSPKCSYVELNRAIPNASCYFLAEGDKDPDIVYIRKMTPQQIVTLRISEFNRDQRLSEPSYIKGCFEI